MITGFSWIQSNQLCGGGLPGLLSPLEDDLEFLRAVGVDLICTLTEDPLPLPGGHGFELIHFPIMDMSIPQPALTYKMVCELIAKMESGRKIFIHCRAGKGRTGTILATIFVAQGISAKEAIKELRIISKYYLETKTQEKFVEHFGVYMKNLRKQNSKISDETTPAGSEFVPVGNEKETTTVGEFQDRPATANSSRPILFWEEGDE